MIYRADQIRLWPRLLDLARPMDPLLAGALEQLVRGGASLEWTQQGVLKFGAGTMDADVYAVVMNQTVRPRVEKVKTLQARMRGGAHPWAQAVMKASTDLDERCKKAQAALVAAKTDPEKFRALAPQVLDRFFQAMLVARCLCDSGIGRYLETASRYYQASAELDRAMKKLSLAVDDGPRFWPVETDGGWLWLTDYPLEQVGTPRGAPRKPQEGEPVITQWDMAGHLALLEAPGQQREAG